MLRRKKKPKSYYQRKFERDLRKAIKESKAEAENTNDQSQDNNNDENDSENNQSADNNNNIGLDNDNSNASYTVDEPQMHIQNDEENYQSQQNENDDQIRQDDDNSQFKQVEDSEPSQKYESSDQLQKDDENEDQIQQNDDDYQLQQVENSDQSQKYENSDQLQKDNDSDYLILQDDYNYQSQPAESSDKSQQNENSNQIQEEDDSYPSQQIENSDQSQKYENSEQNQKDEENDDNNQSQKFEDSDQSQQLENDDQIQQDDDNYQSQLDKDSDQSQQLENDGQIQQDDSNQSQQFEGSDQSQQNENENQIQQSDDSYQPQLAESSDQSQQTESDDQVQQNEARDQPLETNDDSLLQQVENDTIGDSSNGSFQDTQGQNTTEKLLAKKPTSSNPKILPKQAFPSLPLPVFTLQAEQKNGPPARPNSFTNPLFVEFEIEAPKPNSPKLLAKKHSSPQMPHLADSSFSSTTTSSTTSSDDDKKSNSNHDRQKPQIKSLNLPLQNNFHNFQLNQPQKPFQFLIHQNENRQQIWKHQNQEEHQKQKRNFNEDDYFGINDDDEYSDYNDVEVDDDDQFGAKIPQKNEKNSNSNKNNQYKQIPLQQPQQIRERIHPSRINDPKLISAFMYLDEFDAKKKIENDKNKKKSQKYELTHNGFTFYTFDRNKENDMPKNSFPTDPIKPTPKMSMPMNVMMGLGDDLNQFDQTFDNFDFDDVLNLRPSFEAEVENGFHITSSNDHNMANNGQIASKTYAFEIAPYLQGQNQKQQQTYTDQIIKNVTETNDNSSKIHISNDESEINENIGSNRVNDRERSRYYQQNDYFCTDDDYDIDLIDNLNNNETNLVGSETLNKKNENPFYASIGKLGKPISKEIDIASFPTIPFRPMNSEDVYSLMMNSMVYNDKMFFK